MNLKVSIVGVLKSMLGLSPSGANLQLDRHLLAGTDNTYDVGASGATRPRTIYVGTSFNAVAGAVLLDTNGLTLGDAKNIIVNATTGTKIGTATTQKIGFWNATPVVQPASASQAILSLDVDVTGADTVDKAAINTNFTSIQTLVNQLRSDLVTAGIIKGSA